MSTNPAVAGRRGPLCGLRVVEFAGLGPGPHCAMLLADQGAEVLRIVRDGDPFSGTNPVVERGRSVITLNLKAPQDLDIAWRAIDNADVLIEGFRPGVMERLGLGPDAALQRNPRLVYGRMTGWGQQGPLAAAAGHDINYIALAGALDPMGEPDRVARPPLNLLGDYGGGSLYLAFGILAAVLERQTSGKGQVVDAAIVDGTASLMALFVGLVPQGWTDLRRGRNLLGGGAPFYRCFRCADGREISVGALEPQFYQQLVALTGTAGELGENQNERERWADRAKAFEDLFATRTQKEWCDLLEGSDACFAPVLTVEEAAAHPHLKARETYLQIDGFQHPAPAPRFSRTPGEIQRRAPGGAMLLDDWCRSLSRSG